MKRIAFLLLCLLAINLHTRAQCKCENTAFQAGETLQYKLFFNWKFVWVNAGTATLKTSAYEKDKFRCHLLTHSSKKIDKFFMMRDTMESIVDKDLVPLYYKKAANEGGKYYVDEVWYSYPANQTHLKQRYVNRRGEVRDTAQNCLECAYDMLSMMLRARSFDVSNFQKGQKIVFPMADGRRVNKETLIYRGKKNFQMEGTKETYRCLVFSFVEYKKKKENEIITFYVTDDENHMPVRLDLFLKFGTAKAFLNRAEGLRNPVTSIVK